MRFHIGLGLFCNRSMSRNKIIHSQNGEKKKYMTKQNKTKQNVILANIHSLGFFSEVDYSHHILV